MADKSVRVAIVGVGNCASSLVQGVHYYRGAADSASIPGLMHTRLGPYHVRDVVFSAAFDVAASKVGRDLGDAINAFPNNTVRFADVPRLGVVVERGPTLDGLGRYLKDKVAESDQPVADVVDVLVRSRTDVVVNYLPVGSETAARFYAEAALQAGCAFVNCMPVFIASNPEWRGRFAKAGLPIVGDDIKSQVGATIVHRMLAQIFRDRGVHLDRTYQLNFGGNADFENMLERERLQSKKVSKTGAVMSAVGAEMDPADVHVGPSDHVPWLTDRKWAYIRMEGTSFGGLPLACELKLEVWDSPNSAGVVIDAVRCAKLAMDRGRGGALLGPSAAFMKTPPVQMDDADARDRVEAFIQGAEEGERAEALATAAAD
ncbi:MAG TPA: inositol-3-phosphate synthase [Azospirillaceae bacterium]|nr:inositol-3-phosphate synthase [Azospirillaceae bacterium]